MTKNQIIQLAVAGLTLRTIAQHVGLSGERVRQILAASGLTTVLFRTAAPGRGPPIQCNYCGASMAHQDGKHPPPAWGHCCHRRACRRAWSRRRYGESPAVRARHHASMLAHAQRRYGTHYCERCGAVVMSTRPQAQHRCWACRGRKAR